MRQAVATAALCWVAAAAPAAAQERTPGGSPPNAPVGKPKPKPKTTAGERKRPPAAPPVREGVAPTLVEVEMRSIPRGAAIVIDGQARGVAPIKLALAAGRRVVTARLADHVEASITLVVEAGMGYLVFSLAPAVSVAPMPASGSAVASAPLPVKPAPPDLKHKDAIVKAHGALKQRGYADALRFAEAALAKQPGDDEARMIATIAACGLGDARAARATLPTARGSYREVSLARCAAQGVDLADQD
jgi:hypothetical protein